MKAAILSNVNMDMLAENLKKRHEVFTPPGYGQWMQECIAPGEAFAAFDPEMIFLLIDGNALYEHSAQQTESFGQAFACVHQLKASFPKARIWVSNIDIFPRAIQENDMLRPEKKVMVNWEEALRQAVDQGGMHIFDLQGLIALVGRENFYSDKMWYMGLIPYSIKGISRLAEAVENHMQRSRKVKKKVLIVDLDHTIWGGTAGEDGLDGVTLSDSLAGAAYKDLQKRIAELASMGVLLAVVSKNNKEDAYEIIRKHPHMVLKEKQFAAIMANWDEKSDNIKKLAKILNLGLDSFVFFDDNPLEREKVKIALPEVCVPDFPRDIALLPARISEIADQYFFTYRLTAEDAGKTRQYREEEQRRGDRSAFSTLEDYIRSLQIEIEINQVKEAQILRTAQLTQKTNQFNLTSLRFSPEQLSLYTRTNLVCVAVVKDKYGESGLVAAVFVLIEGTKAVVDNLLMSCRVMGRQIENTFLSEVEEYLQTERHIRTIEASYIPSGKNEPVENLMEKLGYTLTGIGAENGVKQYRKKLNKTERAGESLHKTKWTF